MALNSFLKFEGGKPVEGGSVVEGHDKELQLLGFGCTVHNTGSMHTSTGGGTGKGEHGDLSFQMELDKAAPLLHKFCMSGQHFDKVTLFVLKSGGDSPVEYMRYEMEDVMISSFSWSGGGGDSVMASGSLNFGKYNYAYVPQSSTGTPEGEIAHGFNIATGKEA
jgi:type VI secretion system secreted protein Hcp